MIKLALFLIFGTVALIIVVRTWIRNSVSKNKEAKLLAQLKTQQIHLPDFLRDYHVPVNTQKIPPPGERTFEQWFSKLEILEKFEVKHFQKFKKGEFMFVTRSYIDDYVFTGAKNTHDIRHYDTYIFIVKLSEDKMVVCSDAPMNSESRSVRADFARSILKVIEKNKSLETETV